MSVPLSQPKSNYCLLMINLSLCFSCLHGHRFHHLRGRASPWWSELVFCLLRHRVRLLFHRWDSCDRPHEAVQCHVMWTTCGVLLRPMLVALCIIRLNLCCKRRCFTRMALLFAVAFVNGGIYQVDVDWLIAWLTYLLTDWEMPRLLSSLKKDGELLISWISLEVLICDAVHEKVPNGRNGVISMVVQRTYHGIQQNTNHSKIPSTFRDIEFLLEKL